LRVAARNRCCWFGTLLRGFLFLLASATRCCLLRLLQYQRDARVCGSLCYAFLFAAPRFSRRLRPAAASSYYVVPRGSARRFTCYCAVPAAASLLCCCCSPPPCLRALLLWLPAGLA
jgi:hypothetical protein